LRYRKRLDTNFAVPAKLERSLQNLGIRFEIVERVKKRDDDIPSTRDLQIYKLKHEVAELKDDRKNLNDKLTRCLAMLTDDLRAIRLGLHQGQWESQTELKTRAIHLQALIDLVGVPIGKCFSRA
jgi:hypothetical protein